jgi:DivIVA domain-containing protein
MVIDGHHPIAALPVALPSHPELTPHLVVPVVTRPLREIAETVDSARFGVRLRGYDCAEVDELLDRLVVLTHPSSVPPSSPGDDTVSMSTPAPTPTPTMADRRFKAVLRGWDPKEVHEYLVVLETSAAAAPDAAIDAHRRADAIVTSARVEADAILGAARREADDIGRQRDAMDDWFGPQDPTSAPAADRWGALGEHVARLLAQAEAEAGTIVAGAEAHAAATRSDADAHAAAVRAEADGHAATARAEADALLESAASGARAHVSEVLTRAETQLAVTRAELTHLRGQLVEVHTQLGRSIEVVEHDVDLLPANHFIDVGESAPSVADPAPAAAAPAEAHPIASPVIDLAVDAAPFAAPAPDEPHPVDAHAHPAQTGEPAAPAPVALPPTSGPAAGASPAEALPLRTPQVDAPQFATSPHISAPQATELPVREPWAGEAPVDGPQVTELQVHAPQGSSTWP